MKQNLFNALGIIVMIFLLLSTYIYFNIWIPNKKLGNLEWWKTATPKEQRETAHQVLSQPIGNFHDAFIILSEHGNNESIPYLLNTLKKYKKENDFIECAHSHCIEALKKITGMDYGHDYRKWQENIE